MGLGVPELLIILAIVVLIFGAGKLTSLGSGMGKAIKEFKSEVRDDAKKEEPKA